MENEKLPTIREAAHSYISEHEITAEKRARITAFIDKCDEQGRAYIVQLPEGKVDFATI